MNRTMWTAAAAGAAVAGMAACSGRGKGTTGDPTQVLGPGAAYRDIRQETFTRGIDAYPAVSPDGVHFAYQRFQDENYDIWVKLTTARNEGAGRQVTFTREHDRRPSWMGTDRLVFDSMRVDTCKLWRQNASGHGGATLISRGNHPDLDADTAPDGSIAFMSQVPEEIVTRDDQGKLWRQFREMPTIWRLSPDGSMTMLAEGISPAWSPDSEQIAFSSDRQGTFDIYIMDRDGSNLTQLTSGNAVDVEPCWSPDGRWLAFATDRSVGRARTRDFNIWVMRSDGSSQTQITNQEGYEGGPSWGPDQQNPQGRIFFHAYRGSDYDIWSVAPRLDESSMTPGSFAPGVPAATITAR